MLLLLRMNGIPTMRHGGERAMIQPIFFFTTVAMRMTRDGKTRANCTIYPLLSWHRPREPHEPAPQTSFELIRTMNHPRFVHTPRGASPRSLSSAARQPRGRGCFRALSLHPWEGADAIKGRTAWHHTALAITFESTGHAASVLDLYACNRASQRV